jgi:CrcB protein
MQQVFLVAAGGSLGALARFGLASFVYQITRETFPWGTLIVNLSGSFLIGVLVALFDTAIIPSEWRSFLTIGFLGAFTTFSTYSLETVNLLHDGELSLASLNILGTNLAGIGFVMFGIFSCRFVLRTLT